MSVLLDPPTQLTFPRPFAQNVIRTLVVKNPTPGPIAFKVKTTAPKQYCVRPNSGRIEANQTVDVQVILQAMKEDPPSDFKCKDKFLVQSIPIAPEQENLTLQELWTATERQAKESITENKIRCAYSSPIDNTHYPQQPTSPSSPQNLSVNNFTNNNSDQNSSIYSTDNDTSSAIAFNNKSNITNGDSSHKDDQTTTSNKLNNNNSNSNQSEETNLDKLRRKLFEAQDEIKRLNHIIEENKRDTSNQTRQRNKIEQPLPNKNNTPSGIGISVKTQEKVPEGYYPFEVVIGAAIGAFIFGVLFF